MRQADRVTVIVPTLAHPSRKKMIWRAIESILCQKDIKCVPIIIVNGHEYDPELRLSLERDHRVQVHYIEEASFPNAIIEGRRRVDTKYYCFLDDDDILLEESVFSRIQRFKEDDSLDVVIGNGYKCDESTCHLGFPNNAESVRLLESDPFGHLLTFNWLASCAGLYKTDSIEISYFEDHVVYYEWTYIAFRLALSKKIGFVGEPTYKIFSSSGSLSKTGAYIEGQLELIEKLKRLKVSEAKIRGLIDKFCCHRYHDLSNYYRLRKDTAKAWKYHLLSISNFSGLKFISYSRHLAIDSIRIFNQ
jgi:glycosyltransferase involved in cell wall biosynthesis